MKKWWLVLLLVVATGCAVGEAAGPAEIDPSVDSCALCHMGIQQVEAASQVLMDDGTPEKFDDIGCMLTYMKENETSQAFVQDYHTQKWVDLKEAFVVHEPRMETPMNYGFIAFQKKVDAEEFIAANGGEVYEGMEVMDAELQRGNMQH